MSLIEQDLPDVDRLVALTPDELAPFVLRMADSVCQRGMFSAESLSYNTLGIGMAAAPGPIYGGRRRDEVVAAIGEAHQWLLANVLVMPAPEPNATHFCLTRAGKALLANPARFASYRAAAAFPRSILHPTIAETAWPKLARGDLVDAVFGAFRAVEEVVREAGRYAAEDVGVPLMRSAFHPTTGPLRKESDPKSEREALMHLFAGALGSYKNPHSHRTVALAEVGEAQEMVALASHLFRIVESRRP